MWIDAKTADDSKGYNKADVRSDATLSYEDKGSCCDVIRPLGLLHSVD